MVIETRHFKTGDPEPTFPSDGKLQLLSMRFCPYAQRTHIILEAKRIPYHTYNVDLTNKPEWLTKYSPLGKVPALGVPTERGLSFIHESMVIADYLDEKYPEKLLYPKDPFAKAVDRLLIERFSIVSNAFYKIGFRGDINGKVELSNGLDEFETELKKRGTSFFGGKEPGMLDYMIWPWMERLVLLKYGKDIQYEIDEERFAALTEWSRKMIDDYAVKVHYITGDIHRQFVEGFKSKNVDYDILLT
uniref:Glutathione S-transferase n=1 Tax=Bradysia odoriphaga TaxID=1564500 RepID=A0A2S0E494_9DIPT|nr:glutathione S-transferase [Bradysia odoriphaga]